MTKTTPNYLRLHLGADSTAAEAVPVGDLIQKFWTAYSDATGWRVDRRAKGLQLLPAVTTESIEPASDVAVVGKSAAMPLAETASGLVEELEQSRKAVRRQEAELASRAANLTCDSDRDRLADRLEQTLADAAAACGCDAAALYMLDDETQFLKTRAVFGLSPKRLEEPARQLRGSRADLEAMVKGVVAIDDLQEGPIDTWNCPEPFAAGICAVIQVDDVPIGTLWMFAKKCANFGMAQTAAARLAASHLSLELASASRDSVQEAGASESSLRQVSHWQQDALPLGAALANDWRADGMIESPRDWATGWHTWDVLPDGTLMLAIAEAVDGSAKGAMSAAIARAALTAHTGYRHTPAQVMQRISDTLWQTSSVPQLVSMLYARVDPETGEGEVASAGSISALVGSRYGYRPLVDGKSDPLNSHIDARCVTETFRLREGETLLAYTRGLILDGASQRTLGEETRSAMQVDDRNPLARIRRSMADLTLSHERGAATLLRHS